MSVLLAALLFAGCTGQGPQTPAANVQDAATGNSDYYLQQMQQSADDNKVDWQLLAIKALLNEGKFPQANDQLSRLPQTLNKTQAQEALLLQAQMKLVQQDVTGAAGLLKQVDIGSLSKDQQSRYYQLQIAASQGRPSLEVLRAYIAQEPLLTNPADKQKNIDATWQALLQLTPAQLNNMVINSDENTLQGWLDLLNLYKANSSNPDMLKAGIKDWQTRYPYNPGAKMLPSALSQLQNAQPSSTAKIALLLPLSGQAQIFANAIKQGFEDAKNGALPQPVAPAPAATAPQPQDSSPTPADAAAAVSTSAAPVAATQNTNAAQSQPAAPQNSNAAQSQPAATQNSNAAQSQPAAPQNSNAAQSQPATQNVSAPQTTQPASAAQVQIYDTSTQPIDQLLAQAQKDGATLVVGPLIKNNVEKIASLQTPLNILALNEPETIQNRPNLCYFALSPEDEARDAAQHMWDQGKRTPLMLVPRSSLGDRVSKAFATEWQKLGGNTVLQQQFGSTAELKQEINSGAGLSLTGTPYTVQSQQPQAVTIAGLTIPAPTQPEPVTASDNGANVDAVYVVATQSEMELIKPMIAMRTSSRSMIAIYASSRSFQAGSGPDFRLEMEGVQFSDAPMLTGANPALMQQAARTFNNDYSLMRLYAMGVDAWSLANHFNEMRHLPGFQLNGETGNLSATQDCVITRKLTWSQYRQGQIVPAT